MYPRKNVFAWSLGVLAASLAGGCAGRTVPLDAGAGTEAFEGADATSAPETEPRGLDGGPRDATGDTTGDAPDASPPWIDTAACGAAYLRFRYSLDDGAEEFLSPCLAWVNQGIPFQLFLLYAPDAGAGTRCGVPLAVDVHANPGVYQGLPSVSVQLDPPALSNLFPPFTGPGYFPLDALRAGLPAGFLGLAIPTVAGLPQSPFANNNTGFRQAERYPPCRFRVTQSGRNAGDVVALSLEASCDLAHTFLDSTGSEVLTEHVMHLHALSLRGPMTPASAACGGRP